MPERRTSKELIAGLYNRAAPIYDQLGPTPFSEFGRRLAAALDLRPGARVLDVAAGRGANLFAAAERIGNSGRVVGIDLAGQMMEQTQGAIMQRGVTNVSVCQMDGELLGFPSDTFDFVLCGFAIFWFVDQNAALSEFFRVTRRGGELGLSLGAGQDTRWDWYRDLLTAYMERHALNVEYGGTGYLPREQLLQRIAEAGFVDLKAEEQFPEFVYCDEGKWWDALWMHGSRSPLERMTAQVLADFRRDVMEELRRRREPDGFHETWPLLLITAHKR